MSCATIATVVEGMATGTTTAIAAIATAVATIAATSSTDTSLAVSCVEVLEALTAVRGSAMTNGAGVTIKVLGTTSVIVTVLAVELLGSTLTRFVASDRSRITAVMTVATVAAEATGAVAMRAMAIRALLPSEGCDRECSGDSEFAEHVGVGGIGFDFSYELAILLRLINSASQRLNVD